MKIVIIALGVLILLLQYPLWIGKGGWRDVLDYRQVLNEQVEHNEAGRSGNSQIAAEIADLKTGLDENAESARSDLGMIKEGEVFFKTLDSPASDESN
ncbi:MAG: septum formation initiator family protein [Proteobacteria bacterium]|nr:septum formation initiator family protein [Pseudomonadota bacterium]MDA1331916.1 septum formation initiator family protein [Pseudomonadota bacterium]